MAAAALAAACLAAGTARGFQAPGRTPAPDYRAIFGARYADAERFLGEHAWIVGALELPAADAHLALAVVFPELIRFGAIQDEIQMRGLKVLYVLYGRNHGNFSVGRFQMKPSFAEQVESDYARLFTPRERAAIGIAAFERGDTAALRERRVRRLEDLAWQVRYLRLFVLVMGKRYRLASFTGPEDRLRFYATAYNAGYAGGEAAIRRKMDRRLFHTALFQPAETYNYADVALSYYTSAR